MSNVLRKLERMVDYAGPRQLILGPSPEPVQVLNLERSPLRPVCECGQRDLIILPNLPGRLDWRCGSCGREHGIGFRAVAHPGRGSLTEKVQREPFVHECMACGRRDPILLPAGTGRMRWECGSCRTVWGVQFDKAGRVDLFKINSLRIANG